MKNLCIIGSTGSIGTQTLDIVRHKGSEYKVKAISGNKNAELLVQQAREFKPDFVAVTDINAYKEVKLKLLEEDIKVLNGTESLSYISSLDNVDMVVTSVVGMIGLKPTVSAIRSGKTIALANKETLVTGGDVIKNELIKHNGNIIPVDSEHCAIHQCISNGNKDSIRRLILTASGGPFRNKKKEELKDITPEMAIKHPKWNMGRKISIDSATLMNKALEVIEAHYLFDMDYDKIDVIIHPQSIVHSMVEYIDGNIIAQIGDADMRHPIQYALEYPERTKSPFGYFDFLKNNTLTFESPDRETFEALNLGIQAGRAGGSMTIVLNAANEEAVNMFLNKKISFLQIVELVKCALDSHKRTDVTDVDQIIEIEQETRDFIRKIVK